MIPVTEEEILKEAQKVLSEIPDMNTITMLGLPVGTPARDQSAAVLTGCSVCSTVVQATAVKMKIIELTAAANRVGLILCLSCITKSMEALAKENKLPHIKRV